MQFADGSSAMIDTTGTRRFLIYPDGYSWTYTLRDGLLPFRDPSSRKWAYGHPDGRYSIPARFDFVSPFSEGRAVVKIGDLNGIIDPQGKWIVTPSLTVALDFREHLAAVQRQDRWLFLDHDGRPAFDRDFE